MKIKDKILSIRKENNLTQEELAEILCVSRQTISNWETKGMYPDIETLILISDKFKISLDDLLKEDKEMIKDIDKEIKKSKKRKYTIITLTTLFIITIIVGSFILIQNKINLLSEYNYTISEFKKDSIYNKDKIKIKTDKTKANQELDHLNIYIPETLKEVEKRGNSASYEDELGHKISIWVWDHSVGVGYYGAEFRKNGFKTITELIDYYENHVNDEYNFLSSTKEIKFHMHCATFLKNPLGYETYTLTEGDIRGLFSELKSTKILGINANHKYYQVVLYNYSKEEALSILETIYFN